MLVLRRGFLFDCIGQEFSPPSLALFLAPHCTTRKTYTLLQKLPPRWAIHFRRRFRLLKFRNPVLSAFANAVWHCSRMADISDRQLRPKQTCRLFAPLCACCNLQFQSAIHAGGITTMRC